MMGKPVIAGTRITVELVLEKLAAGYSIAGMQVYRHLSEEGVRAAIEFAREALRADVVYPVDKIAS